LPWLGLVLTAFRLEFRVARFPVVGLVLDFRFEIHFGHRFGIHFVQHAPASLRLILEQQHLVAERCVLVVVEFQRILRKMMMLHHCYDFGVCFPWIRRMKHLDYDDCGHVFVVDVHWTPMTKILG
jgi:hypothetical protein